jgi:hypothetical protein
MQMFELKLRLSKQRKKISCKSSAICLLTSRGKRRLLNAK